MHVAGIVKIINCVIMKGLIYHTCFHSIFKTHHLQMLQYSHQLPLESRLIQHCGDHLDSPYI